MSTATERHVSPAEDSQAASVWKRESWWDIWRCLKCEHALVLDERGGALVCPSCHARTAIENDILIVKELTSENNQVAQTFYDSPLWPRFRFWEKFTWFCNGGERHARNKVLRYLPAAPELDLLDVAIGDGVYLDWLPADWRIAGVDISRSQLDACRQRGARRRVWLAQCEAERLPLASGRFDAVLSIGAFNYFNDPEGALREMVRVARPGAPIVISDEMPDLTDRMLGHKLGLPGLDRWIVSRLMHLGDSFTDMVERYRGLNVPELARRVLPDCRFEPVWHGVGYVLVGKVPGSPTAP
jgi:ubiquinone/menaquinone biosynthesis C-methylase UbiE